MVFLLHPKVSWGDQALEPRESEERVDPETAFGQIWRGDVMRSFKRRDEFARLARNEGNLGKGVSYCMIVCLSMFIVQVTRLRAWTERCEVEGSSNGTGQEP
jgi:hypothetical protein